jgi:chemotaxis protein MotB
MAGNGNAAPIIIKRKKVVGGHGHHGGAWKVAYADFVTAMMAFFLLMWLLGATTEKQRKGIADYFNPTIPVNRVSGGGNGAFGGESIFSDNSFAFNGTGQAASTQGADDKAGGEGGDGEGKSSDKEDISKLDAALKGKGGESATMKSLLSHVVTRVTDEGLVVELFDTEGAPLFEADSAKPTRVAAELAQMISDVFQASTNRIAVEGFVKAYPVMMVKNPSWELSANRAQVMRQLIEAAGTDRNRIARVVGNADRKPTTSDPTATRNNKVELILLRKNR